MQQGHVLNKLNFDLLTPRVGGGGLPAKYLLPFCCIGNILKFNMQYVYVLKNWILTLRPPVLAGGGGLLAKYSLLCCCMCDSF